MPNNRATQNDRQGEYSASDPRHPSSVRALFGKIASRYDLINDLQSLGLHRYWKARLLRLITPLRGETALDLCCGTGDLALALAKKGTHTVGLDFSLPMLAIAHRRGQRAALETTPRWLQGDSLTLPFEAETFDLVTIAYGLRNLADLQQGLKEIRRVLKPSGRLATLDFGKPQNRLWRGAYFAYLRCGVPLLGRCFAGDAAAYAYILRSLKQYPSQQVVADLLHEVGFHRIRIVDLVKGTMAAHYAVKRPEQKP